MFDDFTYAQMDEQTDVEFEIVFKMSKKCISYSFHVKQRHENAKNGVKFRCDIEHDAKFFGVISQELVITKTGID